MLLLSLAGFVAPAQMPTAQAQPAAALQTDPGVAGAQQDLDSARARLQATQSQLDDLAATFEDARSHAERLTLELAEADDRIADAESAVVDARGAQAQEVRHAYMQPGVDLLRVSGAFLMAPDVGTALHASAMMQRVAANRAAQAQSVQQTGRQVMADVTSQRGIATGAAAAMHDVQSLSETFTAALDVAVADVAAAEVALSEAEQVAQEQAEAAAAEAARLAQTQTTSQSFAAIIGQVPAPGVVIATVNGGTQEMACPLGQPNGFIDSWGFPRSGGARTHKGVDMFAAYGMPIFAAADGTISRVFDNTLGGLSVDLVDVLGNRYYYAHLSATYVTAGQAVQAGELIAANGNSGNAISTPPHLHWQFHPGGGGPVNPYPLAAALCR